MATHRIKLKIKGSFKKMSFKDGFETGESMFELGWERVPEPEQSGQKLYSPSWRGRQKGQPTERKWKSKGCGREW